MPLSLRTLPPSKPYLFPSAPVDFKVRTGPSNRFVATSFGVCPKTELLSAKREKHNREERNTLLRTTCANFGVAGTGWLYAWMAF